MNERGSKFYLYKWQKVVVVVELTKSLDRNTNKTLGVLKLIITYPYPFYNTVGQSCYFSTRRLRNISEETYKLLKLLYE